MRENAFVEAWKTQHRRVSMILGLTLLCAPSAISAYAENGVNDTTVQAVMQTKTVKGTVLDENGEPLIGVSIVVKGTSTGTITDFDGKFSINLPAGSKELVVSYIGYKEVIIAAKPSLKIVMEEDSKMIDEVVVTGYMAEKKASLTGSVAVVKMKEVADIPTGNVMSGLQGRVAGMNVTTDGKPGGGNTDTKLRGITTINNSSPLYVIDGIQTHDNVASIISSNDVESIQVLKDAASAAIYGAQAANGVIIITTKRAKEGDVKVSFDMSLTAQTFAGGVDMLDAYQWGDVYWQAYKNTYGTHPNSVVYGNGEKAQLQEYYFDQNGVKIKSGNTDWAKEIFGTALMQNYNLSLSKGFKDGNVALTINYMNQDGLCRNTDYERFNSRLASNFRFVDGKVRVGESISVNHWLEHLNPAGIEELVIAQHPAIPVYDENGGYAGGYVDILGDKPNAIRLTDNEANNRHKSWRIFGNVYLEVEPIKNLVLKSQFGLNYTTGFNSTFVPKWSEADRKVVVNELTVRQDNSVQWVWSNTANYSIDLGKNNISAVIGTEAKKENGEHLQGYGRGLVIEDLDYRYLDTVTEGKSVSNNASTYAMVSYFGKVNYAFDDKSKNYKYRDLDGHHALMSRQASLIADKGMVLVCSAGNSGMGSWKKITPPGDADNVLTVGAVDKKAVLAPFSSIGNTADGRVKPDVVAVGAGSDVIRTDGNQGRANGTSFSSPIMCGMVACLWQACPKLTAKELVELVRQAGDRAAFPDNIYGYGVPDMWKAYNDYKSKN